MNEIKFEKGKLTHGIEYEWAKRSVGERTDLVIHFFLGKKKPDPQFFEYLKNAAMQCIDKNSGVETAYTEEFDGHDIIVFSIEGWKASAIKNSLVSCIESQMDEERTNA